MITNVLFFTANKVTIIYYNILHKGIFSLELQFKSDIPVWLLFYETRTAIEKWILYEILW